MLGEKGGKMNEKQACEVLKRLKERVNNGLPSPKRYVSVMVNNDDIDALTIAIEVIERLKVVQHDYVQAECRYGKLLQTYKKLQAQLRKKYEHKQDTADSS